MKTLSKGTKFALFTLLAFCLTATVYGLYDIRQHGDSGGSFWFAGLMLVLAIVVYIGGRKTDRV